MGMEQDFTPTGIKIEGAYENDRNSKFAELYKAIIRECFGVKDVLCGHHLVYAIEEKREDGFTYQLIEEIPSADTLIFDHEVARKLWGERWKDCLVSLALEPVETRDTLLKRFFEERT